MIEEGKVKLLATAYSPYSRRVELALKLKGVDYEYVLEDLKNKSPLLLASNPVYKKIPVLIHDGKPIAETLMILEYIDETWNYEPRLMPTDPYERAHARFWCRFIDEKMLLKKLYIENGGPEIEEEIRGGLNALENELKSKGKKFFGGDEIGMVDIVGTITAFWISGIQEAAGKYYFKRESFPLLSNWADALLSCDVVKETMPDKDSLVVMLRGRIREAEAVAASKTE